MTVTRSYAGPTTDTWGREESAFLVNGRLLIHLSAFVFVTTSRTTSRIQQVSPKLFHGPCEGQY